MKRQIYIVHASVVDANGSWNQLSNYPKKYDSVNYDNDIDKTLRRAEGDFYEVYGAMCKQDTRQVQTVMLVTADGFVVDKKSIGQLADIPDPEPETEE